MEGRRVIVDPSLSRGILKGELREIALCGDLQERLEGIVARSVLSRTAAGKRLDPLAMQGVVNQVVSAFGTHKSCLDVQQIRSRRHFNAKRDFRYVLARLIDTERPGFGVLSCIRVKVHPHGCVFTNADTPFSFHQHAAERLLQRIPGDWPRNPMATMAKALQDSVDFLALSLRLAYALPNRSLGIPFMEGMLLGDVVLIPVEDVKGRTVIAEMDLYAGSVQQALTAALVPDVHDSLPGLTHTLTFRAKTFIGPRELGPDQVRFVREVRDLVARHERGLKFDGWMATHLCMTREEMDDFLAMERMPRMEDEAFDAAYEDLVALFRSPNTLSAIGASGPLMRDVPSYREVRRERARERAPDVAALLWPGR